MIKNSELFVRDPAHSELMNNGQARITSEGTDQERDTLREELSNFVCEGQYEDGMVRILESYLQHLNGTSQPAAWVSGFFGSGKSHLLKMLCHLWIDTEFPDGSRARSLVKDLPEDVVAALKELDTEGRKAGGLHAVSGTLPSGDTSSVRLTVLGMILRSKGLPEQYAPAKFCLYLKNNGFYDQVKAAVEAKGKDFFRELNDLTVSPVLHDALVEVDAGYGDRKSARETIRGQFKKPADISSSELLQLTREVLSVDGKLPCTIIVLDEVQIHIGDSKDRTRDVVDVAEALSKQLESRIIVVGAGQNALASQAPHFKWLQDRFTIPIELSDTDVETVTRRVLLQKKPEHVDAIRKCLDVHSGEIERQLSGTRIGSKGSDREIMVEDYPLLPVRRRFWEHVFRAVDPTGTSGMLRSQLRIIHDALHDYASSGLGTVVPADLMFDQLQPSLVHQGVLLRELDETIRSLDDGTEKGKLKRRLCGLTFLIRKIPREAGFDIGVRASEEMLADLMVSDLQDDGARLRKEIPDLLEELVNDGILLKDHSEYNLQTKEYSDWDAEFRKREQQLNANSSELTSKRDALIRAASHDAIKGISLIQGERKEKRKLAIHFGDDAPVVDGDAVPVWIRDEYSASEKNVVDSARAAGTDSPIVFVFLPRGNSKDLEKQIVRYEASTGTIKIKGVPSTPEGDEARSAMESRQTDAQRTRDEILGEIVDAAKVFKGGGAEVMSLTIEEKVKDAAKDALDRMFPKFGDGDHKNWPVVISRAKNNDDAPLGAVSWTGETKGHPVCKALLREIGAGCEGRQLQKIFGNAPYGWSQDAIDGAIMALHNSGDITVRAGGDSVPPGKLDQTKIKKAELRQETITLSASDKIALRGLFPTAGVPTRPSDDLEDKSSEFLKAMFDLASRAGGDAPLPVRPDTDHLTDLRNHAGNERLAKLLAVRDELSKQAEDWTALAELSEKRMPQWQRLGRLMKHGDGMDEFADIRSAADGIRDSRLLLEKTDHVTPLVKKAAAALRSAVTSAHDQYESTYNSEFESLKASESWQKTDAAKQSELMQAEGLNGVPAISVGSDDELLRTLDATPLSSWKDKTDALTSRFASVDARAAKLHEPKLQRMHLSSGTLKTPDDVKFWLAEQEAAINQKLKDGPVVIS
ncbi:BREX system P-loop protein BrxC [Rhodopirellula sp. P2]|uniref:BREX system P-loop protein BrxC n=1 Tax=Rhodopirellula sp. P2 TaxID=2127060 RepID=UPI0023683015|nr:BREX system P-loop protein BrxC [Rhodopirellula sp. P2]WDQ14575.1 BREX system P-loop protein BrxC [Rhodopirellula sp. P2]